MIAKEGDYTAGLKVNIEGPGNGISTSTKAVKWTYHTDCTGLF